MATNCFSIVSQLVTNATKTSVWRWGQVLFLSYILCLHFVHWLRQKRKALVTIMANAGAYGFASCFASHMHSLRPWISQWSLTLYRQKHLLLKLGKNLSPNDHNQLQTIIIILIILRFYITQTYPPMMVLNLTYRQ